VAMRACRQGQRFGMVLVEDTGQGSRFSFTLPIATELHDALTDGKPNAGGKPNEGRRGLQNS
jgi:hypothetical protein